jgi:hypothetical protein
LIELRRVPSISKRKAAKAWAGRGVLLTDNFQWMD